jgi:nicotinate dehydrogenase subunit A
MAVELEVNGIRKSVSADPDTPLLYVLRNDLDLKGARFGCGSGQCGACFVLVDGRAMASCDMPLWSAEGKRITTVEGLAASGKAGELHAVQRALIAEQAAQCAFCASGIAVAAAALLATHPRPTESEVRAALDRNLCRCGSHNRVVRAVLRAARELAHE